MTTPKDRKSSKQKIPQPHRLIIKSLTLLLTVWTCIEVVNTTSDPAIGFVSRVVSVESVNGHVNDANFVLSAFDWVAWRKQWQQWLASHWNCSVWGEYSSSSSSNACEDASQAFVRLKFRVKSSMTLTHLAHYSLDFVNAMSQFPWFDNTSATSRPTRCDFVETLAFDATHSSPMSISLAIPVPSSSALTRKSILLKVAANSASLSGGTNSSLMQYLFSKPQLTGQVPFLKSLELVDLSAFGELFVAMDFHPSVIAFLVLQDPPTANGADLSLLVLDCVWNLQFRMRLASYFQEIGVETNDVLVRLVRQMPLQVYNTNAKVVALQIHVRDSLMIPFVKEKLWDRALNSFLQQQMDPPLQLLLVDVDDAPYAPQAEIPLTVQPIEKFQMHLSLGIVLQVDGFSWQQIERNQWRILEAVRQQCTVETNQMMNFGYVTNRLDVTQGLFNELWGMSLSDDWGELPSSFELHVHVLQLDADLHPWTFFRAQLDAHPGDLATVLGFVDDSKQPQTAQTVKLKDIVYWPRTFYREIDPQSAEYSALGFVEAKLWVASDWVAQEIRDFFVTNRLRFLLLHNILTSLSLSKEEALQIVDIVDLPSDCDVSGNPNVVFDPFVAEPQVQIHIRVFIKREIQRFLVQKLLLLPTSQHLIASALPNGQVTKVTLNLNADGLLPLERSHFIEFPGVFGMVPGSPSGDPKASFAQMGQVKNSKSVQFYDMHNFHWEDAQTMDRSAYSPTSCSDFVPASPQQFCLALHFDLQMDGAISPRNLLFHLVSSRQQLDAFQGGSVPVLRPGANQMNDWVVIATVQDPPIQANGSCSASEKDRLTLTFAMGFAGADPDQDVTTHQHFVHVRIADTKKFAMLPVETIPPMPSDTVAPLFHQMLSSVVQVAVKSPSNLIPFDRLYADVTKVVKPTVNAVEVTLAVNTQRHLGLYDNQHIDNCSPCLSVFQQCDDSLQCLRLQSCFREEIDRDAMVFVRLLSQSGLAIELQSADPVDLNSELHVKPWHTASSFFANCLYDPQFASKEARGKFVNAMRCALMNPCSLAPLGVSRWRLHLKYTPKAHVLRFPQSSTFGCDLKMISGLDVKEQQTVPGASTWTDGFLLTPLSQSTDSNAFASQIMTFLSSQGMQETRVTVQITWEDAIEGFQVTIQYEFARAMPFVQTLNGDVADISSLEGESFAWQIVNQ